MATGAVPSQAQKLPEAGESPKQAFPGAFTACPHLHFRLGLPEPRDNKFLLFSAT